MLWILLSLLLLWVGGGLIVWYRGSGSVGTDLCRSVDRRVASVGSELTVTLRMIPPAQSAEASDHDVILAIDHSSSMGAGPGSPLREAVRAAERFVRRSPSQVHVGVVVFDHQAELLCPVTGNHDAVLRALAAIGPGGATAIHEALICSHEALEGGRSEVATTVILLSDGGSDRSAAERAAAELRQHSSKPGVLCIGFGAGADEGLLAAVAGSPDRYCHVSGTEELESLFGFLAAVVSGQVAVSGIVDEPARAPHPYSLGSTGELYPLGVHPNETGATRVVWSVPLFDLRSVSLDYRLTPECPGWHAVAATGGSVTWRMPDGSSCRSTAPEGPRVLVLPELLRWAWPLLNPFLWLLLKRFICRKPEAAGQEPQAEEPASLPQPSLPAPLPEPQERPYQTSLRPALVIGLGEVGEWALCRLKDRSIDRDVDPGSLMMLSITAINPASRTAIDVAGSALESSERISLDEDLRPYVESLRATAAPSTRAWIPWQEWLQETTPLTTVRTLGGDRRKARLALLQNPVGVEERLESAVASVLQKDGQVILVGEAADAECSGLLAEVAHICAAAGGSCSAVLTCSPVEGEGSLPGVIALAGELERMIRMRGDVVLSDRHDPAVAVRKLFDRVVVLPSAGASPEQASGPAAEVIWSALAYQDLLRLLPTARVDDDRVTCCSVSVDTIVLPAYHLWRWVRERTLSQAINGQWLGLEVSDDGFSLPSVAADLREKAVREFWKPESSTSRPQNRLLTGIAAILQGHNPFATLIDQLPMESTYDEQSRRHRHECLSFTAYCEQWCHDILQAEREGGRWGLPLLVAAARRIECELETVRERIEQMAGNRDLCRVTALASDVVGDLERIFSGIRREVEPWVISFCGEQSGADSVSIPRRGSSPLAYEIEHARKATESRLRLPSQDSNRLVEKLFDTWYCEHGHDLLAQLCFRIDADLERHRFGLRLRIANQEIGSGDVVADELRGFLDGYRNAILCWPLHEAAPARDYHGCSNTFRIGKHAARLLPGVPTAVGESDPYLAAAICVHETTVTDAFGVRAVRHSAPPYAWPEDTNAQRIASRMRRMRQREPRPFSPAAVHLLRDTTALQAFFAELAHERVTESGGAVYLDRNGRQYCIGVASDGMTPQEALGNLERILRQVVAMKESVDGEPIPQSSERTSVSPETTIEAIERHAVVGIAREAPQWPMWKDVIEGLTLEVGF